MPQVTRDDEPPAPPPGGPALALQRRPQRRGVRLAVWGVTVLGVVAAGWWYATHPAALATSPTPLSASTPVGEPVYLGVFALPGDSDRTLELSGVRVFATATTDVEIVPYVCRGGSVSVTTDPLGFCQQVVPTEGALLRPGDEVMLEVRADAAGGATLDRVRLAYRDGVQWGVQPAGAPSTVQFLAR